MPETSSNIVHVGRKPTTPTSSPAGALSLEAVQGRLAETKEVLRLLLIYFPDRSPEETSESFKNLKAILSFKVDALGSNAEISNFLYKAVQAIPSWLKDIEAQELGDWVEKSSTQIEHAKRRLEEVGTDSDKVSQYFPLLVRKVEAELANYEKVIDEYKQTLAFLCDLNNIFDNYKQNASSFLLNIGKIKNAYRDFSDALSRVNSEYIAYQKAKAESQVITDEHLLQFKAYLDRAKDDLGGLPKLLVSQFSEALGVLHTLANPSLGQKGKDTKLQKVAAVIDKTMGLPFSPDKRLLALFHPENQTIRENPHFLEIAELIFKKLNRV